ncbi:shufflon system plasmid conjugative transfer pilus tip adhesin PilV [Salmonella enterica]|nr:shufflon system plasmid conjugative transfer pilus tip adhesin PilV [Salmonella enterica]EBR4566674.1 shufflon system plasmid conjugative transfer pilus tip adhesin PilV [Salmonella enterica]EBV2372940.1 Shufflon protein B [Salmonella enterica subsp. enterica serovar Enteritidis]ECJ2363607.1 shufflon system plasmid conjugative transfer pilus tip adhesin PilV [Salmonella enterica subsp. diarizonae]ECJ2473490.1 shufflon system plasmid conjugative transfer pilus tip adhesin PilV [Salmonella ent
MESYAGHYYTSALASATTTRPVTITAQMLKNTGFLPAGFRETNSNGQQLKALLIRNARHEEVLQGLVITSGGQPLPYKALRQISLDISSGLGGYIRDGRTATGAMNSWTVPLAGFGTSGGNGHIAVLLSPETLTGAREDSDRLYRFQVNGRPELNKMHTSIDMGGNNLNSAGVVNGRYGNFDVSVVSNGPVTAGGDIRSTGGWIISRHGRGWMDESHGGGFYMTDNEWIRSLNNKSIYTGGQLKGGSVRSESDLSAGGVLKLDQTSYAGTWCSQTGAISHDASGGILLCQSGVWVSSGKLSSFEVVSGNNACGRFVNSVAYCPAGKQLISGGYVLSKWSGGNGWNSPDLSMPSPSENAWKIYTGGGVSGGTCMQAISWCARN